jgi:hypothetical protein
MKDKRGIFLLFLFCFFFVGNLFAKELNIWTGGTKSDDTKAGCIVGVDYLCYDVSKKIKLGYRTTYLKTERNKYKTGNGLCTYVPFMFGCVYYLRISKNFAFDPKFFTGIGFSSYRGEKSVIKDFCFFDFNASVGIKYNLTKKLGLGFDIGYRRCGNLNEKDNDKFNLSGFQTALNCCFKI